jgi:hypothetical protein
MTSNLQHTAIPIRQLCEEMGWRLERAPTRLLSAEQVARNPRAKGFLRQALVSLVGDRELSCNAWTQQEVGAYIGLVMSQLGFDTVAKPNGDRWLPDDKLELWRFLHSVASQPEARHLFN